MKMFSLYRYKDTDLEKVLNTVDSINDWAEIENDPITDESLEFKFSVNQSYNVKLLDENKKVLFLEFRNEKLSDKHKYNPDIKKRIRRNDSEIVLFEEGTDVIVVPLRGKNFTTGSLIRTALNINKDKILLNNDFEFNDDFFYWIFNRYLNNDGTISSNDEFLEVTSLTSFSGETRDTVNKIVGDGTRISEILWTLAFLFTNETLKSITPEIKHQVKTSEESVSEIIKLDLTLTGSYKIDISNHIGSRLFTSDTHEKTCYLILYTYDILIPKLKEFYHDDLNTLSWSPQIKKQFISSIGSEIQDQVNQALIEIESEVQKEFLNRD